MKQVLALLFITHMAVLPLAAQTQDPEIVTDVLITRKAIKDKLASIRTAEQPTAREVVSKRGRRSLTFLNDDGSFTTHYAGSDVNYLDDNGQVQPVQPALWTTANGWRVVGGPVTLRVIKHLVQQKTDIHHIYRATDNTKHRFTLTVPTLTYKRDMDFSLTLGGIGWTVSLDGAGLELKSDMIETRRGPKTYSLDIDRTKNVALSVSTSGDLVGDDGFLLTRAIMVPANTSQVPCSAWTISPELCTGRTPPAARP